VAGAGGCGGCRAGEWRAAAPRTHVAHGRVIDRPWWSSCGQWCAAVGVHACHTTVNTVTSTMSGARSTPVPHVIPHGGAGITCGMLVLRGAHTRRVSITELRGRIVFRTDNQLLLLQRQSLPKQTKWGTPRRTTHRHGRMRIYHPRSNGLKGDQRWLAVPAARR
jgi:hypothetical protein